MSGRCDWLKRWCSDGYTGRTSAYGPVEYDTTITSINTNTLTHSECPSCFTMLTIYVHRRFTAITNDDIIGETMFTHRIDSETLFFLSQLKLRDFDFVTTYEVDSD